MLRSFCVRQSCIATQIIRCHSTQMVKSRISLTFLKSKQCNIERFREIRRCFASDINKKHDDSKDSKQDELERVYKGLLTRQIKMVKVFSLTTSVTGVFMQPILYKQTNIIGGLPMLVTMMGIVGFFTFVTPILLHLVCKKYIITLDYNKVQNEYIATTYTFFMTKKLIKFKPEDVKIPEVPGMFTSILVKGEPLFLDPNSFEHENIEHYVKIMGFDKPIDFKLNLEENDAQKKT
uniref:CSON006978 protein n=1 Tax=Culicoides sonorensis TaxID=179676 RepID=A0A336MYS1_CULSO